MIDEINYFDFLNMVEDYYGSGSDQWVEIAKYGISSDQFVDVVSQVPNLQVKYHKNGTIAGYYRIDPQLGSSTTAQNIGSQINSNVQVQTIEKGTKLQTPAETVLDGEYKVVAQKGISGGGIRKFIGGEVLPATAAVGVGLSMGKTVASALYSANPDFFEANGMSTLNPETWSSITCDMNNNLYEEIWATGFNLLLGINPQTNKSQAYIDENAFAYLAAYMASKGAFADGKGEVPAQGSTLAYDYTEFPFYNQTFNTNFPDRVGGIRNATKPLYCYRANVGTTPGQIGYYFVDIVSEEPFEYSMDIASGWTNAFAFQYEGITAYICELQFHVDYNNSLLYLPVSREIAGYQFGLWKILAYGVWNSGSYVDGIDDKAGDTKLVLTGISDLSDIAAVLTEIKNQFPDLETNSITNSVVQPDGTVTNYKYLPIPMPNSTGQYDLEPVSDGEYMNQTNPEYDPQTMPQEAWDWIWKTIVPTIPTSPDTGDGDSPLIVAPTGSASALWKIYNPSQLEVDTFGAWLWSSSFVDQILKVFSNPMEAIISLHKIFVTPSTSGSGPIKVGYLVSNATANYVDKQYVDIDCGSVQLNEFYGNSFDYSPYTDLKLFLPFIGIVDLSVDDCMRGTINVVYHVDVLTGSCLAEVKVKRDSYGGTLYTFSGNCAVQYPVSSGSYVGIITGILGIGATLMSGNPAPALLTAGSHIGGVHTNVSHSGNISANSGAMGPKKPYLIIERPIIAMPNSYEDIEGISENQRYLINELTGYVKVKQCEYKISCTDEELDMIKEILENGFYI